MTKDNTWSVCGCLKQHVTGSDILWSVVVGLNILLVLNAIRGKVTEDGCGDSSVIPSDPPSKGYKRNCNRRRLCERVRKLNRSFTHQIKKKCPTLQPKKHLYRTKQCGSRSCLHLMWRQDLYEEECLSDDYVLWITEINFILPRLFLLLLLCCCSY